jgi:hypothetical protein
VALDWPEPGVSINAALSRQQSHMPPKHSLSSSLAKVPLPFHRYEMAASQSLKEV